MVEFFLGLTIVILTCVALGFLSRSLKQPLILAYIISGILLGPLVFKVITKSGEFTLFSEIGVALLLFIVGMNMSFKSIKDVGKISLIIGFGQVIFTSIIGFFIGRLLGFNNIESLYISIALAFSSTIIIIKLLSDKNDLDALYGRISVGLLLVQDFIAIFALIFITGISSTDNSSVTIFLLQTFLKSVILFIGAYFLYDTVVPFLFRKVSGSGELLFMGGIAWCFGLAMFSRLLGFGIEIGAFLAGITLASLPYTTEISARIRPLRDFFILVFFFNLGLNIVSLDVASVLIPSVIFSLFVLIGNPLIVLILMVFFGYKKRTGFLVGLTVAQISEFSLILVVLVNKFVHLSNGLFSLVIVVGIVTITLSTYMIMNGEKLYNIFSKYINIFEGRRLHEKHASLPKKKYDIIVCGAHRMGHGIVKSLANLKERDLLVVDFNPDIIKKLEKENVDYIYGDISDSDIIEKLTMYNPKIVVSTIPIYEDSLLLINKFKNFKRDTFLFFFSKNIHYSL